MRFLIVGAGAIGGYVGGSLALGGHAVTFVARPNVAASLAADGLRLTWARTGETRVTRRFQTVSALPAALAGDAFDCLVLAVKAYDTEPAAAELKAATDGTAPPPILVLQNGVDAEATLASVFGPQSVISGTVTSPISKQAGGLVIEKTRGMGLARGHPLSQPLAAALAGSGVRTRLYPAAGPMKWSKLLTNLVGNATSAIVDLPVAALFADPRLYAIEKQTLWECLLVMRGLRYPVVNLPGAPARWLGWTVMNLPDAWARPLLGRFVSAGRGSKMPSLNLDVQAGRARTEVRWLNGAVARHGATLGIPTPVNTVLTETVEGLTSGRLDRADFRHKPEALFRLISDQKQ
jgi:2-dehydropantoate 2-reductase